jgi:hypothetical protein
MRNCRPGWRCEPWITTSLVVIPAQNEESEWLNFVENPAVLKARSSTQFLIFFPYIILTLKNITNTSSNYTKNIFLVNKENNQASCNKLQNGRRRVLCTFTLIIIIWFTLILTNFTDRRPFPRYRRVSHGYRQRYRRYSPRHNQRHRCLFRYPHLMPHLRSWGW